MQFAINLAQLFAIRRSIARHDACGSAIANASASRSMASWCFPWSSSASDHARADGLVGISDIRQRRRAPRFVKIAQDPVRARLIEQRARQRAS